MSKGKTETGLTTTQRESKSMKPSGESRYAKKLVAQENFIKRGGTYEQWLIGRRDGTIRIN